MPQRLLIKVPLNRDPCDVAGILDHLQVDGVRTAHLTIVDGESTEDLTFAREQGSRPNGTNTVRQDAVTIIVPNRLTQDVGNIDRLSPIYGRAAGGAFRANRHSPCVFGKSRKTGCGCAIDMLSISIGKPNGA